MLKEGTLIPTNRGVIPIEQFGFARREKEQSMCQSEIMLKTYDGDWNKCVFQTYKKSKGIRLKLSTKLNFECSEEQNIMTTNGIKKAKNIKPNDRLCCYVDSYISKETSFLDTEKIGYIPKEDNDIFIPKRMTEELATICGILISPSTTIRVNDDDKLVVVCKDRVLNKIFIRYIRDLFQTKQKIVVQDDQYCRIFSPYIIDYLDNLCGLQHKKQQIPSSLLRGNRSIQMSFLNGLAMSEEDNVTGSLNFSYLYEIVSKEVANAIESMVCLYGYMPFVKKIKNKRTICIRKPVSEYFSDKLLDGMKKSSRQVDIVVEEVVSTGTGDYYGIITEQDNYAIKNIILVGV